jgi:hypothetical protein
VVGQPDLPCPWAGLAAATVRGGGGGQGWCGWWWRRHRLIGRRINWGGNGEVRVRILVSARLEVTRDDGGPTAGRWRRHLSCGRLVDEAGGRR